MEFWILLWKAVFLITLFLFTGMAVWVTIGGYSDIKHLLSHIGKDEGE